MATYFDAAEYEEDGLRTGFATDVEREVAFAAEPVGSGGMLYGYDISDPYNLVQTDSIAIPAESSFANERVLQMALDRVNNWLFCRVAANAAADPVEWYLVMYDVSDMSNITELDRIKQVLDITTSNYQDVGVIPSQSTVYWSTINGSGQSVIRSTGYFGGGFVGTKDEFAPGVETKRFDVHPRRELILHSRQDSNGDPVFDLIDVGDSGAFTSNTFSAQFEARAIQHGGDRDLWFVQFENTVDPGGSDFVAFSSDRQSLTEQGRLTLTHEQTVDHALDDAVDIIHAIDANRDTMTMIDVSDPTSLQELADWEFFDNAQDVAMFLAGEPVGVVDFADSTSYIVSMDTDVAVPPDTPSIVVDAIYDGAEIATSGYSHGSGTPHKDSRYQIREADETDWSDPHHDSDWTADDLEFHKATPDDIGDYEARAAHRDENDAVAWSDPVAFTLHPAQQVPGGDGGALGTGDDDREDPLFSETV